MTTAHRQLSLTLAACIASASLVVAQPALASSIGSGTQLMPNRETVVESDMLSNAKKIIQMILRLRQTHEDLEANRMKRL